MSFPYPYHCDRQAADASVGDPPSSRRSVAWDVIDSDHGESGVEGVRSGGSRTGTRTLPRPFGVRPHLPAQEIDCGARRSTVREPASHDDLPEHLQPVANRFIGDRVRVEIEVSQDRSVFLFGDGHDVWITHRTEADVPVQELLGKEEKPQVKDYRIDHDLVRPFSDPVPRATSSHYIAAESDVKLAGVPLPPLPPTRTVPEKIAPVNKSAEKSST